MVRKRSKQVIFNVESGNIIDLLTIDTTLTLVDSFSVLPALCLDGVIDIRIIEGSFSGNVFNEFIMGLLEEMDPYPARNSVIVMDNAAIHKTNNIHEHVQSQYVFLIPSYYLLTMFRNSGMRILYLLPYSPDFNPIEEAFSSLKRHIQHNDLLFRDALKSLDTATSALVAAAYQVMTPENAAGWYKDCGYLS
jgi:transposase